MAEFDFTVNNKTNTYHKEIMRITPQNRFIQISVKSRNGLWNHCYLPSATTFTPESDHGNPG